MDYVLLLGMEPYRGMHRLPYGDDALGPGAEAPLKPADAVGVLTERYNFKSRLACRQWLYREQNKIKAENRDGGGPGSLVDDFPIPGVAELEGR